MDMCLLCLELNKDTTGIIEVTSTKWKEENMEKLIEKHFWPVRSITTNSWLCSPCWEVVNEFHKFYTRIEDAHAYFTLPLKTELLECNENLDKVETDNLSSNSKKFKEKDGKIDESLNLDEDDEDDKPLVDIKTELHNEEQPISDNLEIPIKTRRRRKDPLEKASPIKSQASKRKVGRPCKKTRETKEKSPEKDECADITEKDKLDENVEAANEEKPLEIESTNSNAEAQIVNDELSNEENPSSPMDITAELQSSGDSDSENDWNDSSEHTATASDSKPRTKTQKTTRTKRNNFDEFLSKNFKIVCSICQVSVETFHELCKHCGKEHNERGYVICCNKKFSSRSTLVEHVHHHLDPNYCKCKFCGKTMADRRCLEAHVKIHEKQEKSHICDECGKGFARPRALRIHQLIHLPEEEKKFGCNECGKHFGNNNLLSNHTRVVHLNKYALVCDICGMKMRSKDVFERHRLKHNGEPIPMISCDICGLKLTDQNGLKRHKAGQHPEGGKQDFHCPVCAKISPTLKAHKRHVKYKHEMGFNFKCTICDKAFKRSCSLKDHMATHTGTVLHTCPYCPKTFNSNGNMHSHRKKAHPKEWEEACRAKYSGNLPPKFKPQSEQEIQNDMGIYFSE